jgi:hypothetical protein
VCRSRGTVAEVGVDAALVVAGVGGRRQGEVFVVGVDHHAVRVGCTVEEGAGVGIGLDPAPQQCGEIGAAGLDKCIRWCGAIGKSVVVGVEVEEFGVDSEAGRGCFSGTPASQPPRLGRTG